LEDSGAGWDQFAVNRDKFGVETTFNEELYTTALKKESCNISEQEAARIAREIESQTGTTNYHILEERGGELDADEVSACVCFLEPPYQLPRHVWALGKHHDQSCMIDWEGPVNPDVTQT